MERRTKVGLNRSSKTNGLILTHFIIISRRIQIDFESLLPGVVNDERGAITELELYQVQVRVGPANRPRGPRFHAQKPERLQRPMQSLRHRPGLVRVPPGRPRLRVSCQKGQDEGPAKDFVSNVSSFQTSLLPQF